MADRWREPFRPELQVKQYVAAVRGAHGRFAVFTTKSGRHYLFAQLDPHGAATGLQVPVLKTDLRRDVASALANGWGNDNGGSITWPLPS